MLREWIWKRKPPRGAPVSVEYVDRLLSDWRQCARVLADLPAGPDRDATAVRCARMADAYKRAFRAQAPRDTKPRP